MTAPNPGGSAIPSTVDPSALEGSIAGAGLSVLASRTQANVTAAKKAEVRGDSGLNGIGAAIFAGLPEGLSLPLAILNAVGQGLGAIGAAIWNTVEAAVTGLGNFIGQFLNGAGQVIGNIAGAIVDGVASVGQWLSSLWQAFTGNTSDNSPKTVSQVKAAGGSLSQVAGQADLNATQALGDASIADGKAVDAQDAAAANAVEIAAIRALQTGNDNSGVSAFDNFEYVTSSGLDPAKWSWVSSGTGYVRSDGVKARWVDSGSGSGTWIGRYTGAATITSYQVISTVIDSPILESPILGSAQCFNYLFGRADAALTSFIYLKIGFNTLSIWKVVSGGADIPVGDAVSYTPRVGDSIQLVLGTGADIRQFKILVNNQSRYTVTDSTFYGGVLSVENSSTHNFTGMAFAAAPRPGGGQSTPGAVGIFAMADNQPAPTVGSGIRVYRSSTNSASISTGYNIFPLGWFGQVDYKTPDITYESLTGKCTVSVEGWYQVVIQQHGDSGVGFGAGWRVRTVLWKGTGSSTRQVVQQGFNRPWNQNIGFHGFNGTFLVYLKAGDYIEPGYWSDGSASDFFLADTAGTLTWFSMALVNRSYA